VNDADQPQHDSEQSSATLPDAEFIKEFTRHQRPVFLFILSQISNPVEAEEILQETNLVIWKKFELARYEVLKWLDRNRRDKHYFSDDLMEQIAQETLDESTEWELRREALTHCLKKLKPVDRELIQNRYSPGQTGKELAEEIGRPLNSVYQSLGRSRRALLECIQRQVTSLESGS
jgi:RNA polymerase sigma-70 factor (ECF subfamily)